MQDVHKQRLKGFLVFVAMGMLSFGIFYVLYNGPWNHGVDNDVMYKTWRYETPKRPAVQEDKIILNLGQPMKFGNNKYVYHGLQDGQIQLSVYILILDPDYAYHHKVAVKKARQGLKLAGHKFRLIYYSTSKLILGLGS